MRATWRLLAGRRAGSVVEIRGAITLIGRDPDLRANGVVGQRSLGVFPLGHLFVQIAEFEQTGQGQADLVVLADDAWTPRLRDHGLDEDVLALAKSVPDVTDHADPFRTVHSRPWTVVKGLSSGCHGGAHLLQRSPFHVAEDFSCRRGLDRNREAGARNQGAAASG